MKNPLEHIKVLDFSRVLAGPYCTMILANMGAEIIKVERPVYGDDSRAYGPFLNGQSAYFISINRGKKSISLDLKSSRAIEIVKDLVKEVDIIVENFRPGIMEKLGIGYDVLKEINPKIIFASISGFGQTGPYSKRPAYDMIVQAMSGIMSITGEEGGAPVRVGTSIGDITAGMFGSIGILAALVDREVTGKGRMIDVAMLDGQIAILENAISRYHATGISPKPLGRRHPSIAPFEAYKTKNSYVIIACGNDALWQKFCKLVGREELLNMEAFKTNDDRVKNVDRLKEYMSEIFLKKTTEEWDNYLNKNGVPCSPINSMDNIFCDPQVNVRRMLVEVQQPGIGKIKVSGNPIKMTGLINELPDDPAPEVGEHNEVLLKKYLGYSDEQIEQLRIENII